MRNADYFKNRKVVIIGLARSGVACANLLCDLGARLSITESADNADIRTSILKLKSSDIKLEVGRHSRDFIAPNDLAVVSPGVAPDSLVYSLLKDCGIPLVSEIEVGYLLCPAPVIAITGTNGKTTVTTLIGRILEAAGKKAFVCGNIGNPFCAEVENIGAGDFVSLEVSSFQLENIQAFKPKIAIILNISRNHLDRYKNMSDYLAAKKRIFMRQDAGDYLVLNQDEPLLGGIKQEARSKIVYFLEGAGFNANQAAVAAAGSLLGVSRGVMDKVFRDFKGIEHRMEYVTQVNGIRFVNDSKSTTVEATVWALKNMRHPVILIAGGREKGNDYSSILPWAREKIKSLILIGEAKERIRKALGAVIPLEDAASLPEAVRMAFLKAASGDCILLSPMCKSFDMFANYEERGTIFKTAVFALSKEQAVE
ncbi:MAG: Mur ligase family protein [Candidatus Omnitrophota bacterium]